MVRYSLLRIFIFFGILLILAMFGMRGPLLLVVSAVVSAVISLIALQGPRERFATQIDTKVRERQARAEAHRTAEDDDEDQ
ncbi:DUF4229 domain-containing protein [Luteipulveratus mongoliensis]|uniref:DUF4229 domain-containing protein n=1 Tax=Luteipulveratus mongoliensis TaxID=571913 RepID=A0A0K1JMP0_9MICO|nr:DUF4229 domain-containing protein [Luteipulveratus mongoliensis]AKU17984.1 hypothetical protein VV02_22490 [Luteipulveratus mongoliensis]